MRIFASLLACLLTPATAQAAEPVEGFTEAYRKVDVVPAEPGILAKLSVAEGDAVKQGQLIGQLDCELQEIALEIARANCEARGKIESATAERDLRKKRAEKLAELLAKGYSNQEEYNRALAELSVAEANLRIVTEQRITDELECKKIAALIERRRIYSPINGVVTRLYREEKEFVSGNAAILTVMQLNPLRAVLSITTAEAEQLKVDQNVELQFPETQRTSVGKVEHVSPVSDAESGTVRVKVLVDNAIGKYRSGERCTMEIKHQ